LRGVLATGHNADDNAETLMLNLLRGSGVRGLKGMLPRQGHIIRPLLSYNRSEILEYAREHGLDYVTDSTNLDSDYRRNYLRNDIFPMLERKWPGMRRAMAVTLRCLADDNAVIEQALSERLPQSGKPLSWSALREFAAPQLMLLRHFEPYGITPEIAEEISAHISSPRPGAEWLLTSGHDRHNIIKAAADGLHIIRDIENIHLYADQYRWEKIELNDDNRTAQMSCVRRLPLTECALPDGEEHYIWLSPEAGMRMRPLGMRGTRLVSDIIRDARLSPEEKSRISILCRRSDRDPVWIPGVKRAATDLIDNNCDAYYHLIKI
ncbi:MAG: tRNA lysidine(34) synthetase TilS, partial [Muribaculaceae bacterium]|nr:tRNA lysidine(34) synthetase TilS [Muribaculaceae bacterium]